MNDCNKTDNLNYKPMNVLMIKKIIDCNKTDLEINCYENKNVS